MDNHATEPADYTEIPDRMFFEAKDYAPYSKPRTKPTEVQSKVARARSEALGDLSRIHERLAVAIRHIRVADDCGMVTSSIDVLVATAESFLAVAKRLAKTADNAEARFEQGIAQVPPAQPEQPGAGVDHGGVLTVVPAHPWLTPEATDRMRAEKAAQAASILLTGVRP